MRLLRPSTWVLFSGLWLTLVLPSCKGDDVDAVAAGRGGSSGAAGAGDGHPSGRAGTESFPRGGTSSMGGKGGAGKGATGKSGTDNGGTLGDAGGAGDAQLPGGGTGNADGLAGVGAASAEGGEPSSGGHGGTGTAGGGGSAGSRPCTELTSLDDFDASVTYGYDGIEWTAVAFSVSVLPNLGSSDEGDLVSLTLNRDLGGDQVGAFELGTGIDENYDSCARCLEVHQDDHGRRYFATAGTLTFDSDSLERIYYPHGSLRDVTLREITLDNDWHSTVVAGGRCVTIANADSLVNEAPPPPSPPGWDCAAGTYGDGYCDCGCGALDVDCASSLVSDCSYCDCGNDDCSLVNATDNSVCDEIWSPPCTAITAVGNVSVDGTSQGVVTFNASTLPNLGISLPDELSLDVYSAQVGRFELGTGIDAGFQTCLRCLTFREDYGPQGYASSHFLATEGTLIFDADSRQMEGYPQGTIRNVTLRELRIDRDSDARVLRGGRCLTVANADVLVNVAAPPGPPPGWVNCPASYYDDLICDCGCGVLDSDCASSSVGDCQFCNCGDDDCSLVNATENFVCEPAPRRRPAEP